MNINDFDFSLILLKHDDYQKSMQEINQELVDLNSLIEI